LCWIGTFVDAGLHMCPRATGGESVCKKKSHVLHIQSSTSGSGTYTLHLEKHDAASQAGVGSSSEIGAATASTRVTVEFTTRMTKRMAVSAVVGVCLDHLLYGFASAPGVQAVVATAVKAAAGYDPATILDVGIYLPYATTVSNAVDCSAAPG
jgi:hypothetical protein